MSIQTTFAFHLYGDSLKIEKSTLVVNGLKEFFWMAIGKISTMPPWSMQAFDRAKDTTLDKYLSTEACGRLGQIPVG